MLFGLMGMGCLLLLPNFDLSLRVLTKLLIYVCRPSGLGGGGVGTGSRTTVFRGLVIGGTTTPCTHQASCTSHSTDAMTSASHFSFLSFAIVHWPPLS